MGSSRLPGKSLMPLFGSSLLEVILHRLKGAELDRLWVATSDLKEDDSIASLAETLGHPVYRGAQEDVLSRFTAILKMDPSNWVIRFTGDNPLIHFETTNLLIRAAVNSQNIDYLSDFAARRYPIGALPEAINSSRLLRLADKSLDFHHRSHVTSHIWQSGKRVSSIKLPIQYSENREWRWTIDEDLDKKFFYELGDKFGPGIIDAKYQEVFDFLNDYPEIAKINLRVNQKKLILG